MSATNLERSSSLKRTRGGPNYTSSVHNTANNTTTNTNNSSGNIVFNPSTANENSPSPAFSSPKHKSKQPATNASHGLPLRHHHGGVMVTMCSKGSNVPTPKGSPLRRPTLGGNSSVSISPFTTTTTSTTTGTIITTSAGTTNSVSVNVEQSELAGIGSPKQRHISEEQWVDGPRISRAKVAEARHLLREVNHVKQCETWIDGPKSQSTRSLTTSNLPTVASQVQGYGFMDSHKKSMIRQWVEYQTSQIFQSASARSSPTPHYHKEQQAQHFRNITHHMAQLKQSLVATTTATITTTASTTTATASISTTHLESTTPIECLYATANRQHLPANSTVHQLPSAGDQNSPRSSQLELVNPIGPGLTVNTGSIVNSSSPAEIRQNLPVYWHNSPQSCLLLSPNHKICPDEPDLYSTHSLKLPTTDVLMQQHPQQQHHLQHLNYYQGFIPQGSTSVSDSGVAPATAAQTLLNNCFGLIDADEDQDSGPSEVPPALPLIDPLGSREISHESLHRMISRHVSRESLYHHQQQQQQQAQQQLIQQQQQQLSQKSEIRLPMVNNELREATEISNLQHTQLVTYPASSATLIINQEQQQQQHQQPLIHLASSPRIYASHQLYHQSMPTTTDCGLQVTEEEIERAMASSTG